MVRVYKEDAYFLGLIYSYIYSKGKLVLLDDLNKYYETVEKNLENLNSKVFDVYASVWYGNEPSIYYSGEGKNG